MHNTLVRSFYSVTPKGDYIKPPQKVKAALGAGPLPSFRRFDRVSSAVRLTNRDLRSYHANGDEINRDIARIANEEAAEEAVVD